MATASQDKKQYSTYIVSGWSTLIFQGQAFTQTLLKKVSIKMKY